MDRREFLKTSGILSAGGACAYGLPLLSALASSAARTENEKKAPSARKWGMVIDLTKCRPDCTACMDACRKENNVAFFGNERWDIHLIHKVNIRRKYPVPSAEKSVPVLCNQCDNPPCALACPVKATYQRPDGVVVCDQHRCIGCRYCLIACPYNERYFYFKEDEDWPNKDRPKSTHGVTQSCMFCVHRLDRGQAPACVETCREIGAGALVVGDLNDPESEISKLIATHDVKALREDLGTKPKVYYIGL
jgi:tetrathionate reductase subunit B